MLLKQTQLLLVLGTSWASKWNTEETKENKYADQGMNASILICSIAGPLESDRHSHSLL